MQRARTQYMPTFFSQGFTIVELLVSITIVTLLSTVIIFQFSKFDSQLLLRNVAYEVAGAIREAQVYGVSVTGVGGTFNTSYGVHFDAGAKTYILFKDTGDRIYQPAEALKTLEVGGKNNSISSLCLVTGGSTDCTLTSLDLVFKRPEPDAKYAANGAVTTASNAIIKITSSAGSQREVYVYTTGQISIR